MHGFRRQITTFAEGVRMNSYNVIIIKRYVKSELPVCRDVGEKVVAVGKRPKIKIPQVAISIGLSLASNSRGDTP